MTVYIAMQAPTTWPFLTPVVPAHLMPSGNAYRPDVSGQIQANQADVGALAGYGFALPGSKLPSITDTGTLVTIAADAKITGSLDIAEHLHFHESADPGTPSVGGVIFADTSDHKLKYTFHDGTTTALAPAGGGGSSGLVLIDSGTVVSGDNAEFLDIPIPTGYISFVISINDLKISLPSDAVDFAVSTDGGATFFNDTSNFDTYSILARNSRLNADGTGSFVTPNGLDWDASETVVGTCGATSSSVVNGSIKFFPGNSSTSFVAFNNMLMLDVGATGTQIVAYRFDNVGFLNPLAINPPAYGRVNLVRYFPYGSGACNPPTSGETMTVEFWTLSGEPTP